MQFDDQPVALESIIHLVIDGGNALERNQFHWCELRTILPDELCLELIQHLAAVQGCHNGSGCGHHVTGLDIKCSIEFDRSKWSRVSSWSNELQFRSQMLRPIEN